MVALEPVAHLPRWVLPMALFVNLHRLYRYPPSLQGTDGEMVQDHKSVILRAELHLRLLNPPHHRPHIRLVDAHVPLLYSVSLIFPYVGLLLHHLSNRFHIPLILHLKRILLECTQEPHNRLQVHVLIRQLIADGLSKIRTCHFLFLHRLQIYVACLTALGLDFLLPCRKVLFSFSLIS